MNKQKKYSVTAQNNPTTEAARTPACEKVQGSVQSWIDGIQGKAYKADLRSNDDDSPLPLRLIRSAEGNSLRLGLQHNISRISNSPTPVIPRILGSNVSSLSSSAALSDAGFLVPAIRFPTVPRGTSRLRVSLSAAHPPKAVTALAAALQHITRTISQSEPSHEFLQRP